MSDIQSVMKFEFLPNEILMECFQYLNTFQIFYSFDQLNNRIDTLIHNIPLYIHFENVNKLMFDQFCKTNLSNPKIKNQIYSLKVSNKDQCFQAKIFLSFFPFNELSFLQKFELIIPMGPFNSPSMYGEKADPGFYLNINLTDLLLYKLRTLTIPYVCRSVFDTHQISSIINLTICQCSSYVFYQLLKQFPRLKYLHVNHVKDTRFNEIDETCQYGIHLEKLILDQFDDRFKNFEIFLKQTPNLKSLTISNSFFVDIVDAYRWEHLITSSLSYLNIFKFEFRYHLHRRSQRSIIIDKFKQFQTDFWKGKHHWYTEYVIRDRLVFIHTIPYPFNKYRLEQDEIRHSNSINTFVNVTDLTIYPSMFTENTEYYFSNVTSISLCGGRFGFNLTTKYIQYLKQIVNLCNLKHLDIMNSFKIENSSTFLELLKETSQLSSMTINTKNLQLCFQNEELCKYLNNMIKILDTGLWKYVQLNQFCEIFSNLEHLNCDSDHENSLLFLIEHLPKLSTLKATFRCEENPEISLFRFKTEAEKLNVICDIERTFIEADTDEEDSKDYYSVKIFIWVDGKT